MEDNQASTQQTSTTSDVAKYDLDTLVSAFNFTDRNILKIVLDKSKEYTLDEAHEAINKFKGGVE